MIRLLIADDHAIVRGGLKQIIALAPDIEIAGEATCGTEVMQHLHQGVFDLLLLDLNMPGVSGVDLIARIRLGQADLPILVFTMHNETQVASRALKAGAAGYITKDSDPERLLAAIRKVSAGGKYLDPALAEQMAFDATSKNPCLLPHALLSDREFEVFRKLIAGFGVNEIAEQLSISNKTVSTHKVHMMEKMNLGSVAELVRYAMQHGLTD